MDKKSFSKKIKSKQKFRGAVYNYKKKRRIEYIIIFLICIVIASIIYFLNSKYVKLKTINVVGIEQVVKEDLINVSGLNSETKYYNINEEEIKNKIISSNNIIKDVEIKKINLQTVDIKIVERKLIALEKNKEEQYLPILENGEYYEKVLVKKERLPILEDFIDDNKKRKDVIKNLNELNRDVLSVISEIQNVMSSEEANVYMKDGQRIKVNAHNFSGKLNYYFEIEKYIDNKNETTLNLINGAYLENKKTLSKKEEKIKNILLRDVSDENSSKNENISKDTSDKNKDEKIINKEKKSSGQTSKKVSGTGTYT